TKQHHPCHAIRMTDGILDGDLAAQAASYQMIRRRLDKLFEIGVQLLDQELDTDRQPILDPAMEEGAFVRDQVRQVYVKAIPPEPVIAKPGLRLFRQAINQDQGLLSSIEMRTQTVQERMKFARHDCTSSTTHPKLGLA